MRMGRLCVALTLLCGALLLVSCGGSSTLEVPDGAPVAADELIETMQMAVDAAREEDLATLCEIDEQNYDSPGFSDECKSEPDAHGYYDYWLDFVDAGGVQVVAVEDGDNDSYEFVLVNGRAERAAANVEGPEEVSLPSHPLEES